MVGDRVATTLKRTTGLAHPGSMAAYMRFCSFWEIASNFFSSRRNKRRLGCEASSPARSMDICKANPLLSSPLMVHSYYGLLGNSISC
jgi:hypothetical protein